MGLMYHMKYFILAVLFLFLFSVSHSVLSQDLGEMVERDLTYLAIAIAIGSALSFLVATVWGKGFITRQSYSV